MLPYSLLWASEQSEKLRQKLDAMACKNTIQPNDIKEIVEMIFETKALNKVMRTIGEFTKKGEEPLAKLKKNGATQALHFFAKAQTQLFTERLKASEEQHS